MNSWVYPFISLGVGLGVLTVIYDWLLGRGVDE